MLCLCQLVQTRIHVLNYEEVSLNLQVMIVVSKKLFYKLFFFEQHYLKIYFIAEELKMGKNELPVVSIPKIDDETFTSFFTGISLEKCEAESVDLNESDFDIITSQSEL